jgi:ABC-type transport system involved in cytochrome c biogenesis permease subunit
MALIKYMTKARDERWWIQGLGLMAGAAWAGFRALNNGRPPLLRVGCGVAAICFLAAIVGLIIDRIRATRRGRRGSADDTAAGEQQEP